MKIFYFMGRNPQNKSGVSWKIWKIQRAGRVVVTRWGAAELKSRRPVLVGVGGSKQWRFSSDGKARDFESTKIEEKLAKGYQRRTRFR